MEKGAKALFEELIEKERRRKSRRSLCIIVVVTILLCYILLQIVFGITVVEGESMQPTIADGSIVVFNRLEKTYEANDIVIAQADGQQIIKRIQSIDEEEVFLIGDNREESLDSRSFGTVNMEAIRGRVICVIQFPGR